MNNEKIRKFREFLIENIVKRTHIDENGYCRASLEAITYRDVLIEFDEILTGKEMTTEEIIDFIPNLMKGAK